MPPARLESLAEFLRFLSTMPHPDKVASALTRGPLSLFGTRACRIMIAIDDTRLVLVSQHGHSDEESSRYREIPLDLDMPITQAYRHGAVMRSDVRDMARSVPAYSINAGLWGEMTARLDVQTAISVPIIADGASIGVFGLLVSHEQAWQPVDDALLDVISAVLGLWMTHSHNGIREALDAPHAGFDTALNLTARQVTILHLLDHGRSQDAIAAALGYSVSTVKAEMQTIHRTLRTHDRNAAVAMAYELGILPLKPEEPAPGRAGA